MVDLFNSKNIGSLPFHVIEKIRNKNPELSMKILDEVKYARYIDFHFIKPMDLHF